MSDRATIETARALLHAAREFLEDEADNRSAAGGSMTDYENEPRQLMARIDAFLATTPQQ